MLKKFPFPSNGKTHSKNTEVAFDISFWIAKFPFPSNGKTHSKRGNHHPIEHPIGVSIPFKRENAFQATASVKPYL